MLTYMGNVRHNTVTFPSISYMTQFVKENKKLI